MPKQSGNAYFDDAYTGVQDACKDLGCVASQSASDSGDPTSQIPILKQQIQRGVGVILVSANSPNALNSVLDEAKAKGITVVTLDSDLTGNETHRLAFVPGTDMAGVGAEQIELLGSQIGYQGDFAILSAAPDAPNQNLWIAEMKETLKQPKYAKMHLVDTVYGDDQSQKSLTETQALITKYPNLRGLIAPTSVGVEAAARALELAGAYPGGPHASGGGIVLTGLGTPKQMRGFIDKGVLKEFALWRPHDMGYIATYLGVALHTGKVKPDAGSTFTAGQFGQKTLGKDGVVPGGPLIVFDKSNIEKYNF